MMKRRTFAKLMVPAVGVTAFASGCAATPSPSRVDAPPIGEIPPGGPRNVVLVHGAYADGSCWSDVIPLLHAAGAAVTSVQNPLSSLDADVAATRRALDAQDGPTILVGHSFGGSVITEIGEHPLVHSLVYLSARAPDVGEDFASLAGRFPRPPASAGLVYRDGFGGLTEEAFLSDFANGVPKDRARVLYAVQGRIAQSLFATRTTVAAWRSKPTRYLVTTGDRTTAPELQRFVAQRMGASTLEINTGHLSFVVQPLAVARFILDIR